MFSVLTVKNIQAGLMFALQRALATLIACENEFSPIRLHDFLSFVIIFALYLVIKIV